MEKRLIKYVELGVKRIFSIFGYIFVSTSDVSILSSLDILK